MLDSQPDVGKPPTLRMEKTSSLRDHTQGGDGENDRVLSFEVPQSGKVESDGRRLEVPPSSGGRDQPADTLGDGDLQGGSRQARGRPSLLEGIGQSLHRQRRFFDGGIHSPGAAPAAIGVLRSQQPIDAPAPDPFDWKAPVAAQAVESQHHPGRAIGRVFFALSRWFPNQSGAQAPSSRWEAPR